MIRKDSCFFNFSKRKPPAEAGGFVPFVYLFLSIACSARHTAATITQETIASGIPAVAATVITIAPTPLMSMLYTSATIPLAISHREPR